MGAIMDRAGTQDMPRAKQTTNAMDGPGQPAAQQTTPQTSCPRTVEPPKLPSLAQRGADLTGYGPHGVQQRDSSQMCHLTCRCPKMTLMGIVITFLTRFGGMVAGLF